MPSELAQNVFSLLKRDLFSEGNIDNAKLNQSLRLLAKWRSVLIQNTLLSHEGTRITRGPFKGMDFLAESAEGCHIAKLIGTYEQPLHPHIERISESSYKKVINIGCAEGYYATGLALRMPNSKIFAYDTNKKAQEACCQLAKKNKVIDRVEVFGEIKTEDLIY